MGDARLACAAEALPLHRSLHPAFLAYAYAVDESAGLQQAPSLDTAASCVEVVASDILAIPLFTADACGALISAADRCSKYEVYLGDAFAAPEALLDAIDPRFSDELRHIIVRYLSTIVFAAFAVRLKAITSQFVTRYSMTTQTWLGLHHDFFSDLTVSVVLNANFEGGGLYFPRQRFCTKGLPVGTAVLFPGRVTHPHCALAISSGERYSLTAWTSLATDV